MIADWNWFFSSVAQSAAAMVGLFAAFIITKIINNQTSFKSNEREIEGLINTSLNLVDRASYSNFEGYNQRTRERELRRIEDLVFNETPRTAQQYLEEASFSPFDRQPDILHAIQEVIDNRQRGGRRLHSQTLYGGSIGYNEIVREYDHIEAERRALNGLLTDVHYNIRAARVLLNHVAHNPESSRLIAWSVASTLVLYFVGVLYPLSFLPSTGNMQLSFSAFFEILASLKGLILSLVSIIFAAIMCYFLIVNRGLKYSTESIQTLETYTRFSSYSAWLAAFDNRR